MSTGPTPGDNVRFPGFNVLERSGDWDPVTTGVVLRRLGPLPTLRFFDTREEPVVRALLDRLVANDAEPRLPLIEMLDSRLAENVTDGWRYEDLPPDGEAWRLTVSLLDEDATARHGSRFHELDRDEQNALLESIRIARIWQGLRAARVWSLWTRYVCDGFYSHPWAWNEIGFGGPAYPVGYANLGLDGRENWEEPDAGEPSERADRRRPRRDRR